MVKKSITAVVEEAFTAENAEDFLEVAEKNTLCTPLREPLRLLQLGFVLLSFAILTACQAASSREPVSVSARTLVEEYEKSSADVRSKYDGKEIIVRGYAALAATLPQPGADQGSLFLKEKGSEPRLQATCWFSRDQSAEFSKIKDGQYVTVRGVFNGEAAVELKFCKLVRTE
jgi:hypothetical protein